MGSVTPLRSTFLSLNFPDQCIRVIESTIIDYIYASMTRTIRHALVHTLTKVIKVTELCRSLGIALRVKVNFGYERHSSWFRYRGPIQKPKGRAVCILQEVLRAPTAPGICTWAGPSNYRQFSRNNIFSFRRASSTCFSLSHTLV